MRPGAPVQLHVHPLYNSSDEVVNYAATVKSTPITDGSVAEVECKAHRETLSTGCKWAALGQLTVCDADGAAAKHTRAAREEAAQALLGNHAAVALDLTNPSTSTNIDGKPLTQPEVSRHSSRHQPSQSATTPPFSRYHPRHPAAIIPGVQPPYPAATSSRHISRRISRRISRHTRGKQRHVNPA